MDLQYIKAVAEKRRITINSLAKTIGMSPNNLHKNVRNNSIKAEFLERAALELEEPIENFFDESVRNKSVDSHDAIASGKDSKAEAHDYRGAKIVRSRESGERVRELEEKLKMLEREIETQKQLIAEKERTIEILLKSQNS